ncbi:MAG: hypothetical protein JST16_05785 [Bdellovibrionales bacterium]|nr:hypothetical protein [Bdellovibrionales bacterium]
MARRLQILAVFLLAAFVSTAMLTEASHQFIHSAESAIQHAGVKAPQECSFGATLAFWHGNAQDSSTLALQPNHLLLPTYTTELSAPHLPRLARLYSPSLARAPPAA